MRCIVVVVVIITAEAILVATELLLLLLLPCTRPPRSLNPSVLTASTPTLTPALNLLLTLALAPTDASPEPHNVCVPYAHTRENNPGEVEAV